MGTLLQDLRYGARMLRKNPVFTAVALFALALGIGANTAIFSVVNALLLRPPLFKDPDRLVYLWETNPKAGLDRGIVSPSDFADWREQSGVFEHISAWRTWFYRLSGGDPEQVWGVRTSATFFELLGVETLQGRTFVPEDEQPGRDQIVILSNGLWQRRFGAEPDIVGKTIAIDDRPFTVVGVLPPNLNLFGGTRAYDLWMPFDFTRGRLERNDYSLIAFARLRPRDCVRTRSGPNERDCREAGAGAPGNESGPGRQGNHTSGKPDYDFETGAVDFADCCRPHLADCLRERGGENSMPGLSSDRSPLTPSFAGTASNDRLRFITEYGERGSSIRPVRCT